MTSNCKRRSEEVRSLLKSFAVDLSLYKPCSYNIRLKLSERPAEYLIIEFVRCPKLNTPFQRGPIAPQVRGESERRPASVRQLRGRIYDARTSSSSDLSIRRRPRDVGMTSGPLSCVRGRYRGRGLRIFSTQPPLRTGGQGEVLARRKNLDVLAISGGGHFPCLLGLFR